MTSERDELTYDQFVTFLRSALHYLYDPVNLRRSPLVELLALRNEFDSAAALQGILLAAIGALKPDDAEPPQSYAWRVYDTLSLQYVRQLPREDVANQLGISERQLRREQRLAIEALAQQLWQAQQLATVSLPKLAGGEPPAGQVDSPQPPAAAEIAPAEVRVPLGEALENVRSLISPLAQQAGASVQLYIAAELVALPAPPLALRTILLSVLATAIPMAGSGAVVMTATRRDHKIAIAVRCREPESAEAPLTAKELAALATAQAQAAFYAAQLDIAGSTRGRLVVTLLLAAPQEPSILVIDDNADWLELVQRYAAGLPQRIITLRTPETAVAAAGKLQPALIFLDVMMHNVDGWQVLSDLRHDPATAQIPVVVCSILPLAEMALALGANAFLQKPVSQQQFLEMLAQQSNR